MNTQLLLQAGYASAKEVTRQHAKSFYWASYALRGAPRRAAFALYAFCRRLDDWVDGGETHELSVRLRQARSAVSSLYLRRPELRDPEWTSVDPTVPWPALEWRALDDVVGRFRIPERPFQQLISGMEMDLTRRRYETFAELELYCYRVAGVVGLMLTPVLGLGDERGLAAAVDLGVAMQLTNILRDIREDQDRGRIYLPEDELAAFGLSERDLSEHRVDDRFIAFMGYQIDRARAYYARAAQGIPFLTGPGSQRMVRLMGAVYSRILQAIERQGYDVFRSRAFVSWREKGWLAAQVLVAPQRVFPACAHPVSIPLLPVARTA